MSEYRLGRQTRWSLKEQYYSNTYLRMQHLNRRKRSDGEIRRTRREWCPQKRERGISRKRNMPMTTAVELLRKRRNETFSSRIC